MKARNVNAAVFSMAIVIVILGLLTGAGTTAAQAEVRVSGSTAISSTDKEISAYDHLLYKMSRGEILSDAEKQFFLELESHYGNSRETGHRLDNQGGPDAFNYYFMDNVAPDTATYNWIELDGATGAVWLPATAFNSTDDGYTNQKLPIGFPFPFYGVPYDCVRVAVNGFLEFTIPNGSLGNDCMPTTAVSGPIIAVLWDDLHLQNGGIPSGSSVVGYKQFTNYTVIEFDSIGFYNSSCVSTLCFEAILFSNGNIKMQYRLINVPTACASSQTIGLQDSGAVGSPALNYVCNTTGIQPTSGRAIWFFRPTGIPRPVTNLVGNANGSDVTLTWTDPTLDTQGNPLTPTNIQVWLGPVQTGVLLATVPPGVQTYLHSGAPSGNLTYNIRAYHNPFYGAAASVTVMVGAPSYYQSFDTTNGGWVRTPAAGGWEWGVPFAPPGPTPHSGTNLWGTVLGGYYIDNACWQLDLALNRVVQSPVASVEFWCWYNTQTGYDGCNFEVSTDGGGSWTVVAPDGGYPVQSIYAGNACITGQPAWSGVNPQWTHVVIPIGQFIGQTPIFRFDFGSNASTTYAGFYFDDMQIWGLQSPVGVPRAPTNLAAVYNSTPNNVVLTWTDPTQDLSGNPITADSAQIWLGPAVSGLRLGTVLGGVQTFTHNNPPWGSHQTYTVRAYDAPNYGAPASVTLVVGSPTYVNNFNVDNGMWVPTPSDGGWSWGAPTNPSAPAPYSAPNCWGTGLTANYVGDECWQLDLNLGLVVQSASATVEFWYWFDSEQNYDGCNFKASVDGGATYTVLTPSQGNYTVPALSTANVCMSGQPAWSGHMQTTWQYAVIPVGQFLGQVPIFRFEFSADPIVANYAGFFFDDMIIWGLALPQMATIAGTVTLNGGTGVVTNAWVAANGIGAPSVHPIANGTYTLMGVQVGNRLLTATLAGYDTTRVNVTLTVGGLTGQNISLRRSLPPAPTGLTGSINSATGRDSLHWTVSPDLLVDGYKVYRKLRTDTAWVHRKTIIGRTNLWSIDTVTSGIWNFAVSAIDTNVAPPPGIESERSAPIEQLYGELPPVALTANGNFDNKIRLQWLPPGTLPELEAFYDNGTNEVGGIGFNGQPEIGWFATHFTTTSGSATVTRYKVYFTQQAIAGDAFLAGCFADSASLPGRPSYTELGVVTANHTAPFNAFREFNPVDQTFPSGSFFVGVRQLAASNLSVGGDQTTTFRNNTFFYRGAATGGWSTFESATLMAIPMIRCFVIGNLGNELELAPTPNVSGPVAMRIMASPENSGWVVGTSPRQITSNEKTTDPKSFGWVAGNLPHQTLSDKKIAGDVPLVDSAVPHSQHSTVARSMSGPGTPNFAASGRNLGRNPLDDVIRYIIYRDGTRRDSVLGTVLIYDDTPLPENQTHQYYVTARYDNSRESGPSNTVTAACNMAPSAPTNVTAVKIGTTQARISWSPPTTNGDGTPCVDLAGYRIYRDGTQVGTVLVGTNQYTDTPPSTSTFYSWTIKAYDEVPNLSATASVLFAVDVGGQVPFSWVDISANGIGTAADDDIISGPFNLGFSFPYYGSNYTQVKICSNGWITFNPSETAITYIETTIPNTTTPNCALYPFWDDMDADPTTGGGEIKYYADAANQRFIVAWLGVYRYGTTDPQMFEVIIDQTGSVTFNYQTIGINNSCTAGVENCTGTAAWQLCFDGTGPYLPTSNTAVQFWGGPTNGVEGVVRAQSPSIPIQNCKVYLVGEQDTVTTDAGGSYSIGAEPGTYTVCFQHAQYCDTCYAGVMVVEASFTTRNATMRQAIATFSVSSINHAIDVNTARTDSFSLRNTGGPCALNFTVTDSATWIIESPLTGSIPAGGTTWIRYTYGPFTQTGIFQSSIMVYYNSTGTPRRIPVMIQALTANEPVGTLPTEFELHQNYPNPFNASTSIRFDVPRDSRVDIVIYNMMGQEVAHPVASVFPAGRQQIIFDATNLPSGAYVVRMTAGEFSQLGKMMLLK